MCAPRVTIVQTMVHPYLYLALRKDTVQKGHLFQRHVQMALMQQMVNI
jgi:hypothetical protein